MPSLFDTIPGYREAVEHENAVRQAAFLLDRDEVAGVRVTPLTVRHVVTLYTMGSPFVCGGECRPADVVLFFWVVSPDRGAMDLEEYSKRFRTMDYNKLLAGVREFMAAAFLDQPAVQAVGAPATTYWHWAAGLVDRLASAYHWSEADILNLPLARVFQYIKILDKRDDPKAILFNPSDKVRSEWLRTQNAAASNN